MSDPHVPHPSNEAGDERIRYGKVLFVGVASILTFVIAVLWATQILLTTERQIAPEGDTPLPHPQSTYEVGMVNQQPFEADTRPEQKMRALRQKLSSYGWVDRARGTIHVPVERVMEEMAREAGQ